MDCSVCIELRVENSRNTYYNKPGDWRPRLIIWPEYNGLYKKALLAQRGAGLDADTDEAWSYIVAETIRDFCGKLQLAKTIFRRIRNSDLGLVDRIGRSMASDPHHWIEDSLGGTRITPQYVVKRERAPSEDIVYLLGTRAAQQLILPPLLASPVLDRANLLPQGSAILTLGSDEPLLEISLATQHDPKLERTFMTVLENTAVRYKHRLERTQRHFCPWWARNNRQLGTDDSDDF
jgi:hypothetical protein